MLTAIWNFPQKIVNKNQPHQSNSAPANRRNLLVTGSLIAKMLSQ